VGYLGRRTFRGLHNSDPGRLCFRILGYHAVEEVGLGGGLGGGLGRGLDGALGRGLDGGLDGT
jgi:hypothetical protein